MGFSAIKKSKSLQTVIGYHMMSKDRDSCIAEHMCLYLYVMIELWMLAFVICSMHGP